MYSLFLFKGCFLFDYLSPPVNRRSHRQLPFPQPAKGKETRTLNSPLPLQGIASGTTAMLYCLGMCLGISLSLHLMFISLLPYPCAAFLITYFSGAPVVGFLSFFKLFQSVASFPVPFVSVASPRGSEPWATSFPVEMSNLVLLWSVF